MSAREENGVQALADLREAVYRGTGLIMKPSETYVVAKALLAAGWSRPVPAVGEAATEDAVTREALAQPRQEDVQ